MTSKQGRRQPRSCEITQATGTRVSSTKYADDPNRKPTNQPIIMKLIKQEMSPWLTKAEMVFLQNRGRYHQSMFKNHQKFRNPGGTSVWRRRSYLSSEVLN